MNANADEKEEYRRSISRRTTMIGVSAAILVVLVVLSCAVGTGYSVTQTFGVIWDHITGVELVKRSPEWWADYYICNNVMPGVIMAAVAGAGLAIAGAVMQSIMENPLADAYTTGISSGACLGAVAALISGFTFASFASGMGIMVNAFIGALVPAVIVIFLTRLVGNSPSTMILIGTALSYFFNAMVTLIMVTASSESLQDAYMWQIGSVSGASWSDIPLMFVMVLISSILVQLVASKLNLMSLGEKSAKSLGLDVSKFRMLCLILISFLVASIISFTGIIGFIGLVAPHMARYIVGADNRFAVPLSVMMGAIVLVMADVVSRLLYTYGNVEVGIIMSFLGAPVFLYLIIRRKSAKEVF